MTIDLGQDHSKLRFGLFFANEPRFFIAGDLLWYSIKGYAKIRVALVLDTLVVFE